MYWPNRTPVAGSDGRGSESPPVTVSSGPDPARSEIRLLDNLVSHSVLDSTANCSTKHAHAASCENNSGCSEVPNACISSSCSATVSNTD